MQKNNFKPNTDIIVNEQIGLLDFLLKNINGKSKNNIKSLLVRSNIFVDNKMITKHDYQLHQGQKVTIKWNQINNKEKNDVIDILYEDNDIIVINKPAGLLSIATDNEKEITAYHLATDYVKRKNPKNRVFIVHRIDRDTSGVLLIAKNEAIKHLFQDNWDDLVLTRSYIAVVEGKITNESDTIKSWLKETSTKLVYSTNKTNDGKEAITNYKRLKYNSKYSLLDVNITTGRKNQIRVHMKDIGHCIIGDKKYGARTNPIKRLGLHANVLELKHPLTKKVMRFEAQIPGTFLKLFSK